MQPFVQELSIAICWEGDDLNKKDYLKTPSGDKPIVAFDPRYFRLTKVETLLSESSKAKLKFGWNQKLPSVSRFLR
jgi:GDPmannose 4,6-dehydratase